ncbi:low affinity immunoglobulin gamma Fc region receptor II-b isoform X2 [Tupaia chinensis]|uniref:low affinity immunoglobulin gamma Fc region receptor II-b isoform X2 n=1 Tax=Tupaia chinensis TaxID=246437 RepID=UPI0003C90993|nr:low affinity immunoglobulin gamma Fc region receptor II-b isoform X2 [Tupaia chinensis]
MGIPSFLSLLAAEGSRAACKPCQAGGPVLLWTAVLFLAPVAGTTELPKAVVKLEPPWIHVLQGDTVTLQCQGAHAPGDTSTQWFYNGSSIPSQDQPHYRFKAQSNDSGEFRCQMGQTSLSDPVHLEVFSGWLLLQTPRLVFQEGEAIVLRCHSWKNLRLLKVTFFHNGQAKWFSHANSNFSIPQANRSHSGDYHCRGFIGQTAYLSRPVTITVQGSNPSDAPLLVIVAVVTGIAVVAIAATVAAFLYLRKKRSSALPGNPERREMGETLSKEPCEYSVISWGPGMPNPGTPHPGLPAGLEPASCATPTNPEEAAKVEAEHTITYSLLSHSDAAEEESEPDYQNRI